MSILQDHQPAVHFEGDKTGVFAEITFLDDASPDGTTIATLFAATHQEIIYVLDSIWPHWYDIDMFVQDLTF